MRIERRYTKADQSPYAAIDFRLTTSEIRNPDGSVVFRLENVEVPEFWSQVASDVLAQKYFRKAGVASRLKKVEEETVPSWLWRSVPDEAALADLPEDKRFGQDILVPKNAIANAVAGQRCRPRRRFGSGVCHRIMGRDQSPTAAHSGGTRVDNVGAS